MGRPKRITKGNIIYHAMNRANGRLRIFKKQQDFAAFESILAEGIERYRMRLCGYCIMGNHWHLVLWPRTDGDLTDFMQWGHAHPHPALACGARHRRNRPPVSGPFQKLPRPNRLAVFVAAAVCGGQSPAGRSRQTPRAVAMEQFSDSLRRCQGDCPAQGPQASAG